MPTTSMHSTLIVMSGTIGILFHGEAPPDLPTWWGSGEVGSVGAFDMTM